MAKTLYEFGQKVIQIREAINSIETKGRQNASFILFAANSCDELIGDINKIVRNAEKSAPESVANKRTDGDLNEQDSGRT